MIKHGFKSVRNVSFNGKKVSKYAKPIVDYIQYNHRHLGLYFILLIKKIYHFLIIQVQVSGKFIHYEEKYITSGAYKYNTEI